MAHISALSVICIIATFFITLGSFFGDEDVFKTGRFGFFSTLFALLACCYNWFITDWTQLSVAWHIIVSACCFICFAALLICIVRIREKYFPAFKKATSLNFTIEKDQKRIAA